MGSISQIHKFYGAIKSVYSTTHKIKMTSKQIDFLIKYLISHIHGRIISWGAGDH